MIVESEPQETRINEGKLIILGEAGVGKSTIIYELLGEPSNETSERTEGVNIEKLIIEGQEDTIKINIWDFGGQEIFHSTHQLFMTSDCLYLLVVDSRSAHTIENWLDTIEFFGAEPPILIVINKIDEQSSFDLNRDFILKRYKSIKGIYRVSCKSHQGILELKNNIFNEIKNIPTTNRLIPISWNNVKKSIEAKKLKDDFMTFDTYINLCKKHAVFNENQQEELLNLLNNLGVIQYYNTINLQSLIIINPDWLIKAIYRVINNNFTFINSGYLNINNLQDVFEFNSEKLPKYIYSFIVELLCQYELAYRVSANQLIIPSNLPLNEPQIDFDYESSIKLVFVYNFFPITLIYRLIISLFSDARENLFWARGIVVENKNLDSVSLVKANVYERRIYVYVTGLLARDYLAIIKYQIEKISNNYSGISYNTLIPIPDSENVYVSHNFLLRLNEKGYEEYFPEGASRAYSIKELLEPIQRMTNIPTREEVNETLNLISGISNYSLGKANE